MERRMKILLGLLAGSIIFLSVAIAINAKRPSFSLPQKETKAPTTQMVPGGKASQEKVIEVPVPVKIKKK